MGRGKWLAWGLAFLLGAPVGTLDAQVKTGGKNESARAITISGSLDLEFVHRSEAVNEVLDNEYQRARAAGTTTLGKVEDDDFLRLSALLRFDVELAEKVNAVLSIQNRNMGGALASTGPQHGTANEGLAGGNGSTQNTGLVGRQNEFAVFLGEAYLQVKEFLWQQLSFKMGIQNFGYDLRGNGQNFFLDMRVSEPAFAAPLTEAFAGNVYYGHEVPAGIANTHGGTAAPGNFNGGVYRDKNLEAGGLKLTWNVDDNLFVDIFWFQTLESSAGAAHPSLLPGIAETDDRADETLLGFVVDYNLDEKSLLNFLYAGIYGDDGHVAVHTLGIGLDYYITPTLEAYLEFYGQWGDYGHVSIEGAFPVANRTREIDHEAYAGIVGLKYTFDHNLKPWVDVSFTYISGDDGDISTDGNNGPDTNHDFVSYEDNDATLILESNDFGLDVDSNYWKIQGEMGISASLDREKDFKVRTLLAYAETAHSPTRRGIAPGANGLELDDELGLEWDVRMTWNYTESLTFGVEFAWLFTGDDSFWHGEDSGARTGSAGGPGIGESDGFAVSEGEDMWMLVIDSKLRF